MTQQAFLFWEWPSICALWRYLKNWSVPPPRTMPVFGSFALIIALALALYSFAAGTIGLVMLRRGGPQRAWAAIKLNETARRAGIAVFFAVSAAAFALLHAAFTN